MIMKNKITFIIFLLFAGGIVWTACDKIDDPLVVTDEKDFPENPDDTLFFADSVFVDQRQVLLEEFTGHLCVNCPEAAMLAHDIAEANNHRLIIYTVHAGNFAIPDPNTIFNTDLRSPLSETLYSDFGIFANPIAMIDRIEYGGLRQIFKDSWETVVTDQLDEANMVEMKLTNTYFPLLNTVVVDVASEFVTEPEGEYRLAVYIVEDHIVAPQLNNNPEIGPDTLYNYEHHNVLRAAVSATYGELIPEDYITTGNVYNKSFTYPLNEEWVTGNLKIIAYIGKSDETLNLVDIVQVAELGIKTE